MIVVADSICHGDDLFPTHFVLHALMLPRFPYPLAASGSPWEGCSNQAWDWYSYPVYTNSKAFFGSSSNRAERFHLA